MLKSVIFISESKFVCELFRSALRKQDVECYIDNTLSGLDYLVEDLSADAVVIDENIWDDSLKETVPLDKLIYWGASSKEGIISLSKPLDPLEFGPSITQLLAAK